MQGQKMSGLFPSANHKDICIPMFYQIVKAEIVDKLISAASVIKD